MTEYMDCGKRILSLEMSELRFFGTSPDGEACSLARATVGIKSFRGIVG